MSISPKEKNRIKFALYKITHGISEFITLSVRELEALRIHVVSPLCDFAAGIFKCFLFLPDEEQHIKTKCFTEVDDKTVEYSMNGLRSICQGNGSRIVGNI